MKPIPLTEDQLVSGDVDGDVKTILGQGNLQRFRERTHKFQDSLGETMELRRLSDEKTFRELTEALRDLGSSEMVQAVFHRLPQGSRQ